MGWPSAERGLLLQPKFFVSQPYGNAMRNFRYLAMTQSGELVNGSILAPTAAEVAHRIEYLGLVPIETAAEEGRAAIPRDAVGFFNRPRVEDVTIFTRDLGLLLKAGARLD